MRRRSRLTDADVTVEWLEKNVGTGMITVTDIDDDGKPKKPPEPPKDDDDEEP